MDPSQMYASSMFGMAPQAPTYSGPAAPTQGMGVDPTVPGGWKGLVSPNNPLFWFGVVLAVTFGAAGVAGSVRLGRAKLSAELGQS